MMLSEEFCIKALSQTHPCKDRKDALYLAYVLYFVDVEKIQ
jgi:hypothetical protein